jgi:RNA polymerase sigma factor (sigma-70 family)
MRGEFVLSRASTDIAALYGEHSETLRERALAETGSAADADDLVQDVMLRLLDAPSLLAPVERIGAWLLTLVRRRAIDLWRSETRRQLREKDEDVTALFADLPDPEALLESDEVAAIVSRAIGELDPELREVFVANALDGRSFRELSVETGVPMGTLMARKKKAADAIRARLRRQGIPAPEGPARKGER